jgi:integrase
MSRPRPPHLRQQRTRHGKLVWYFRIDDGPRIRIKAEFGTPEFDAEYEAALAGNPPPKKGSPNAGTLAWLIERYREVDAWRSLSLATRKQRENIFKQVIGTAGHNRFASITPKVIAKGRDVRSATPFQARHFLDTMRGLFEWALGAGFVKQDPAAPVKYPELKSGPGFPVWEEEDVTAYEARWPIGTRQRVWLDVLLYTGLRRGDAVRLGKEHVRNGIARLRTEKSQGKMMVTIPLLPPLLKTIAAGPIALASIHNVDGRSVTREPFICGNNGKPMTKESFGNAFSDACKAAGVNKSAHGLRKIGATRAAYNGATVSQLNAIFGWTGSKMASLYTEAADRARLSEGAIGKLIPLEQKGEI